MGGRGHDSSSSCNRRAAGSPDRWSPRSANAAIECHRRMVRVAGIEELGVLHSFYYQVSELNSADVWIFRPLARILTWKLVCFRASSRKSSSTPAKFMTA